MRFLGGAERHPVPGADGGGLRVATQDELSLVLDWFDEREAGSSTRIVGGDVLRILDRDGNRLAILVSATATTLPPALLTNPDAVGLCIGALEGDAFHLDLQGAVRWAALTSAATVRVTEHAARLFLYGRDILQGSVSRFDERLRVGDPCIVTDPKGEAVGVGRVGKLKEPGIAVYPVHDLGSYLRDQDE